MYVAHFSEVQLMDYKLHDQVPWAAITFCNSSNPLPLFLNTTPPHPPPPPHPPKKIHYVVYSNILGRFNVRVGVGGEGLI